MRCFKEEILDSFLVHGISKAKDDVGFAGLSSVHLFIISNQFILVRFSVDQLAIPETPGARWEKFLDGTPVNQAMHTHNHMLVHTNPSLWLVKGN